MLAGLALAAGLGWWTYQELEAVRRRHHAELERFAEGVLLALDASHDLLRPPDGRPRRPLPPGRRVPGPDGGRPSGRPPDDLEVLEPVLQRLTAARRRVRAVAVVSGGEVLVRAGELPDVVVEGARGATTTDGLYVAWRPLGAPPLPEPRRSGSRPGSPGPADGREALPQPPPGAPIVVLAVEAEMPADALRHDLLQIVQKVGVAALSVIGLLAAWVLGIRGRILGHRLEAEQARRTHLEELSLAASGLAHETKNPLGIIRGLAQRLGRTAGLSEEDRAAAGQILEEADRAVARLGEFMSYARIRTPEPSPVDGREILDKAAAVLAADLESAGVTVEIDAAHAMLVADEEMLLQILLNLMLNSLEASSRGGVISLRLTSKGGRATLSVEDRGEGMEPELQERLFKPYVTGRAGGHGLGLAIVRRLVESHGWSIEVRSRPGLGTTMAISGIQAVTGTGAVG